MFNGYHVAFSYCFRILTQGLSDSEKGLDPLHWFQYSTDTYFISEWKKWTAGFVRRCIQNVNTDEVLLDILVSMKILSADHLSCIFIIKLFNHIFIVITFGYLYYRAFIQLIFSNLAIAMVIKTLLGVYSSEQNLHCVSSSRWRSYNTTELYCQKYILQFWTK